MSYDIERLARMNENAGLNPFGTGQCLTTLKVFARSSHACVSIHLEQGSVLRQNALHTNYSTAFRLNPFGTGQCLTTNNHFLAVTHIGRLNPFGTGQCLTTAVESSGLVRQGLQKPLPNFFRDSESWVLIWLNVEQILTFHLHIKRSKT